MRPGLQPDTWVCRNNLVAWGMVETVSPLSGMPDELSFYVVEGYYQGNACRTRRHTLRVDGFVSINAPLSGGELLTGPLRFTGEWLSINFATSAAGSLRVEIQDASTGQPFSGFALDDCELQYGDQLDRVVSWKTGADLSQLAGKPVRLRIELKDADLYSLQFNM